MEIKITKAIVITNPQDCDHCYLYVDAPSPMPRTELNVTKRQMTLSFDAMAGYGEEYILENFGIQAEVVERNRT